MKSYLSLPKDDRQRVFFDVYAKFALYITLGVILSQLISSFTESAILYNAIYDSLHIFSDTTAKIGAIVGMSTGIGLIELVGLRLFLPLSVDAILYKRWEGLHRWMSIFVVLMTLALISGSLYLSIEGKTDTINNVFDKQQGQLEQGALEQGQEEQTDAKETYQADSTEIRNRYTAQIAATNTEFAARKSEGQQELRTWTSKRGNYQTRINQALTKIEAIEAGRAAKVSAIELEQANELKSIKTDYRNDIASIKEELSSTLSTAAETIDTKKNRYGLGGFWLVLLAQLFSIVGITLDRIFKKGSGIEEKPLPTQSYFQKSILGSWLDALGERFQILARNRIAQFEASTPDAASPSLPRPLLDFGGTNQIVIKLELEQSEQGNIIKLPSPEIDIPTTRQRIGFKQYASNTDDGNALHGKGEENTAGTPDTNALHYKAPIGKTGQCTYCGSDYEKRTTWQKFCTTKCRENHHAAKHGGKKFNPSQYKNKKK